MEKNGHIITVYFSFLQALGKEGKNSSLRLQRYMKICYRKSSGALRKTLYVGLPIDTGTP